MGKGFNIADTFSEALKNVPNSDTGREQIEYIDEALIAGDERNFYELSGLEELAANIELIGLQQPIRVRPDPDDVGGYLIVSGHRRMAAIRQYLKPEAPDKWAQIPCIIERDNVSAAMQELRLIFANSATREMSNSDKAKQAKRVKALLYKLSEEGVEFPGRMRDHVAEAVNATKSQIARWEVIQKGLIPELASKWESGKLNESQAYVLARFDVPFQQRLVKATPKIEKYNGVYMERVLEFVTKNGVTYTPDQHCPDGSSCTHGNAFLLHDLDEGGWGSSCKGRKCCMTCDRGAKAKSYQSPCSRMCGKATAVRQKRAKKEKEAEERERQQLLTKDQNEEQVACIRIIRAAEAAGLSMDCKIPAGRYGGGITLETVRGRTEGCFDGYSDWSNTVRVRERAIIIEQAETLRCSTDYLLGLTDDLNPQPTGQMMIMGWMPGGTNPAHPCDCVTKFEVNDEHGRFATQMLCRWNGENFCFPQSGATIDMQPVKWIELPEDEVRDDG